MSNFDTELPIVPPPVLGAPQPPATNILVGPLGLRAGWGILLFAVLTFVLGFSLYVGLGKATGRLDGMRAEQKQAQALTEQAKAAHRTPPPQPVRLGDGLISEVAQCGAVLLAAFGISFLERRRFAVYGLLPQRLRDLLPGAVWGFAAMSLLIALLRGFHLLAFDRQLLHGRRLAEYSVAWLAMFLLVGLAEEFLFRGYLQFTLTRGLLGLTRHIAQRIAPAHARLIAFWTSAILWSLLFFAAHLGNSGENPAGLACVFLAGVLFSYALWRTGSLWWGIGFHMTWDWAQSFLYGVPDSGTLSVSRLFQTHALGNSLLSGGVDGPEGSALVIPILLLAFLAIRLQPQRSQPPVEPESLPPFLHTGIPAPVA